ncbi:hypothetical protein JCM9492_04490 [Aquifex pyrophilus]
MEFSKVFKNVNVILFNGVPEFIKKFGISVKISEEGLQVYIEKGTIYRGKSSSRGKLKRLNERPKDIKELCSLLGIPFSDEGITIFRNTLIHVKEDKLSEYTEKVEILEFIFNPEEGNLLFKEPLKGEEKEVKNFKSVKNITEFLELSKDLWKAVDFLGV